MLLGSLAQLSPRLPELGVRPTTREGRTEATGNQTYKLVRDILEVISDSIQV